MLVPIRRPHDLLAAVLRVPFVDFLTCMTRPELPLTVHEYGEWGNPSDPTIMQQVCHTCLIALLTNLSSAKSP